MLELARVMPLPGPLWGPYPIRAPHDQAPPWRRLRWPGGLAYCRELAAAARPHLQRWQALDEAARAAELRAVRARLRRDGLCGPALAQALGVVCALARHTLGMEPRDTQRLAAVALLDNRMAEMATGEGKTLAVGLAAAVAALAGIPVHAITSNSYLAARDAEQLAPLFRALGLRVAALTDAEPPAERRAKYRHDIVYATAKDLAFDFLRDRQHAHGGSELRRVAAALAQRPPEPPLLRGLCMALLDEADNILLDEAEVPLILSRNAPQAARRAFLWQALALARQLGAHDFTLHRVDHFVTLTATGEDILARRCGGLGGPWRRPRYRSEAVLVALAAIHVYQRDEHYVVRDGAIELLDPVSGRVAPGRVWSRGLHTVVAMKEGLRAPDETETLAQTTFQRFFQRYWRLGGISGTLWEARSELGEVYGARVLRIALHRANRRQLLPSRTFPDVASMFDAVLQRVTALRASGRPVLVGTDSVAESEQLSVLLERHGVPHQLLNALSDAREASIVALAGRSGSVTVATRMAGRGTDIELDDAARAAGGLHVLSCQHNPSRRLDRQLAGRGARHGDPGSVEAWTCRQADAPVWPGIDTRRWMQWREERRKTVLRQTLLQQDLHWERRLAFAGTTG